MAETAWTCLGLLAGLVVMLPITRLLLRRAEIRARQAERRARDAERLAELGSMTGGLAHEIKNPLSTIGLNAQLLGESIAESDLPDEQRQRLLRRLEALSREASRLRGILTDFLQFAGRVKLDPQPRDLVKVVEELSDFFHPQAQQSGVTLRTQWPANAEALIVNVDEGLLKQALLNLMLNAVQAMSETRGDSPTTTPHNATHDAVRGELMLRVEADEAEARVHVTDTGPGIAPDKINDIFRPYFTMRSGGTGLGLPTAQRIAMEHSGRITVHSEPGRGSDFVIHLPRHTPRRANGQAQGFPGAGR